MHKHHGQYETHSSKRGGAASRTRSNNESAKAVGQTEPVFERVAILASRPQDRALGPRQDGGVCKFMIVQGVGVYDYIGIGG